MRCTHRIRTVTARLRLCENAVIAHRALHRPVSSFIASPAAWPQGCLSIPRNVAANYGDRRCSTQPEKPVARSSARAERRSRLPAFSRCVPKLLLLASASGCWHSDGRGIPVRSAEHGGLPVAAPRNPRAWPRADIPRRPQLPLGDKVGGLRLHTAASRPDGRASVGAASDRLKGQLQNRPIVDFAASGR
jgi:hypothetical protein